jgi:16S rRNA (uracil1498-N3)-methyltransferase
MTRRRWIADEFSEDAALLLGANAAHLARVLRARAGQEYDIVCGPRVLLGTIVTVSEERVEFSLGAAVEAAGEREIVLVAAIYKFDRLEWAIEKCTELGVTRILPVIARRTESHLAMAAGKRVERWRRIAHEAAQQSRRLHPPTIDEPMKLRTALGMEVLMEGGTRLLLNEDEDEKKICDSLLGAAAPLIFAVGPEGGWTAEEVAEFSAAGWRSVSLGATILRAETAMIAAVALAVGLAE